MSISYYLVLQGTVNPQENFAKLVSALRSHPDITVEEKDNCEVELAYKKFTYKARLLLNIGATSHLDEEKTRSFVVLNCEKIDGVSVTYLRIFAQTLNYRVFDPQFNIFLPKNPNLQVLSSGNINQKHHQIMYAFNLEPLFLIDLTDFLIYYARLKNDNCIYFVNPFLLLYFTNYSIDKRCKNEFSYKVAPNLKRFIAMFDVSLVPTFFYQYFGKSTKIINFSGFNTENVKRKVFVKPYIFELDSKNEMFYTLTGEGSQLLYMDKIRKGETLNDTILRILRSDLKIADDYIGAVVLEQVEFDRDREDRVTPRLVVRIYVERIKNGQEIRQKAQRGWKSIENLKK